MRVTEALANPGATLVFGNASLVLRVKDTSSYYERWGIFREYEGGTGEMSSSILALVVYSPPSEGL